MASFLLTATLCLLQAPWTTSQHNTALGLIADLQKELEEKAADAREQAEKQTTEMMASVPEDLDEADNIEGSNLMKLDEGAAEVKGDDEQSGLLPSAEDPAGVGGSEETKDEAPEAASDGWLMSSISDQRLMEEAEKPRMMHNFIPPNISHPQLEEAFRALCAGDDRLSYRTIYRALTSCGNSSPLESSSALLLVACLRRSVRQLEEVLGEGGGDIPKAAVDIDLLMTVCKEIVYWPEELPEGGFCAKFTRCSPCCYSPYKRPLKQKVQTDDPDSDSASGGGDVEMGHPLDDEPGDVELHHEEVGLNSKSPE